MSKIYFKANEMVNDTLSRSTEKKVFFLDILESPDMEFKAATSDISAALREYIYTMAITMNTIKVEVPMKIGPKGKLKLTRPTDSKKWDD